jgi:DNA replication protein DnaC
VEVKSLENYDWSFNPQVPKALILDLATARFVREHGGILLLGPPGTGKSHICIALAVAAIHAGYTVLYRSAFDLVQDMAEAEATGTRKDLVDNLCKVDLLVLEDLGMKKLPHTAAEDPLKIVVRSYEKGSIIMTTNPP